MNSESNNNTDNESSNNITMETLSLISWYATGWLSAEEQAYVQKQLEQHPELKNYLSEEKQIIDLVNRDDSLLELSSLEPTETRLKAVLAHLDKIPQENKTQDSIASSSSGNSHGSTITSFIQSLLRGDASTLRYASFASISLFVALLVAFIAPIITPMFNNQTNIAFHPATVQTPETRKQISTTIILVGLNADTQNDWLDNLLKKNNANMTTIPGKDGLYRIHFNKKLSTKEIETILKQLNNHKETIWFSGEAY